MLFVRQEISIHPKHKILNYASLTVGAISTSVAPSSKKQYHTITNSIKQTRGSLRVPWAEPLNYSVDRAAPLARNYYNQGRNCLLFEPPSLSRLRLSHHDPLRVKVLSAIFNINRLPSLSRNV
ncbi:hypothetical protein PMG11_10401 [Penicillium brasilianum]|uniref:Uncharacterized protein n=1 Tax=Penicillium brasilianum TaxID=104259 RepID=A0A0F7U2H0_PENBI|nr:hypothetical protein PMG11_10401 [Penicillium brasilianum]